MKENKYPLHELHGKDFLKRIMERPGMYVGTRRLDYIQHFADGHKCTEGNGLKKDIPEWKDNYEIQRWLFDTQGVVLHTTTINGWTLFYRCFGTADTAVGQFAQMLHAAIPPYPYSEDIPYHEGSVAGDVGIQYPDMEFGDVPELTAEGIQACIINTLQDFIAQEAEEWDTARVYVWKDDLYTQLRYVFHTLDGWRDDSKTIACQENYQQLIHLHALIKNCPYEELARMHSEDMRIYLQVHGEKAPKWTSAMDMPHEIKDEETLWYQFQKWKTCITANY